MRIEPRPHSLGEPIMLGKVVRIYWQFCQTKAAEGTCKRRRLDLSAEVFQVATTIFIVTWLCANRLHLTLTSIGSMPLRLRCK